jgi:hypothetical protein
VPIGIGYTHVCPDCHALLRVRERQREYLQRPEVRERMRQYQRDWHISRTHSHLLALLPRIQFALTQQKANH